MEDDSQLNKNEFGMFVVGAVIMLFFLLALLVGNDSSTKTSYSTSPPDTTSSSLRAPIVNSSSSKTSVTWGPSSNGFTWNNASYSDKMSICRRMERVSDGSSAQFYFDAFESFYNTTDSSILSTTMDSYSRILDSVSSSLPASQRNY